MTDYFLLLKILINEVIKIYKNNPPWEHHYRTYNDKYNKGR